MYFKQYFLRHYILEEKTSNLTVLCLSVKYTHNIFIVGLINCHVLSLCQPLILNYKQPTLTIRKNTPRLSPALQVCTTWHQRKFSLHWTATLSLLYNIGKEMADYTRLKIRARGCSKFIFSCTVTPQLVSRSETLTKAMTYSKKLIDRESSPLEFVRCELSAFFKSDAATWDVPNDQQENNKYFHNKPGLQSLYHFSVSCSCLFFNWIPTVQCHILAYYEVLFRLSNVLDCDRVKFATAR